MTQLIQHSGSLDVALGERDLYTEDHCGRVETLSLKLGICCALSTDELDLLRVASKLHDVGKIGIPDYVLLKPGRLDADELKIIQTHPELGQKICEEIPHQDASKLGLLVRHHHEAFDGSGYPDGLSGEDIPICSRIISIADSYDAMATTRPYHNARSHEQVMSIMEGECGKKSDPTLFGFFQQIIAGISVNHYSL